MPDIKTDSEPKPKVVKFKQPLLGQLEETAKKECRSFSELIRECCRQYLENKKK